MQASLAEKSVVARAATYQSTVMWCLHTLYKQACKSRYQHLNSLSHQLPAPRLYHNLTTHQSSDKVTITNPEPHAPAGIPALLRARLSFQLSHMTDMLCQTELASNSQRTLGECRACCHCVLSCSKHASRCSFTMTLHQHADGMFPQTSSQTRKQKYPASTVNTGSVSAAEETTRLLMHGGSHTHKGAGLRTSVQEQGGVQYTNMWGMHCSAAAC